MGNMQSRLIGAVLGFLFGCICWVILYFVIQAIFWMTGSDHARFRVPVVLFVLPLYTAYLGFKEGGRPGR